MNHVIRLIAPMLALAALLASCANPADTGQRDTADNAADSLAEESNHL